MRKFKLIKRYPLLDELGVEVSNCDSPNWYYSKDKNGAVHLSLPPKEVENNPEFWEEITEKEWEVLEYNNEFIPFRESAIKSIKRLSDGEIFTIGDKLSDDDGEITGFEVTEKFAGGLMVKHESGRTSILYAQKVSYVMTSIDGVKLYIGDRCYQVDDDYRMHNREVDKTTHLTVKVFTFANLCAAQNFVNENKPSISRRELKDALTGLKSEYILEYILDKFKEL